MSSRVAIFIPTYKRPHQIERLRENICSSTKQEFKIYFIVESDDTDSLAKIQKLGEAFLINLGEPTYASCINMAYRDTEEPFFFVGADDLVFHEGWLSAALDCMSDPTIGVVGTSDPIHNLPDHTTHYLVRRSYIDQYSGCLDIPGIVLYPYKHNFTDWEFIGVAKIRKQYFYCSESLISHNHPGWNNDGTVREREELFDETYAKGNKSFDEDLIRFINRNNKWLYYNDLNSTSDQHIKEFTALRRNAFMRKVVLPTRELFRRRINQYLPVSVTQFFRKLIFSLASLGNRRS